MPLDPEKVVRPKRRKHYGRARYFILVLIILLQFAAMTYVCRDKAEYHIDEIYSYLLSNSYDTDRIAHDESKWDQWVSGDEFKDFVTVQQGEGFSYDKVYFNNSLDCHPPLYYWAVHTVCSFFPEHFSMWFGLVLNLIFLAGADIFIYQISRKLIASKHLQFLPVIIYGFSPIAVETVTFIRMYMLLTMLAMIFCYLIISMIKDGVTKTKLAFTWIAIYLGGMTQYYALVLCFWGVLFFEIYLLANKKIKEFFINGIASLASVALVYFSFPYILTQAFGSDTNNIGNEVSGNLFNIKLHLRQARDLMETFFDHTGYENLGNIACIVVAAAVLFLFVWKLIWKKKEAFRQTTEAWWIFGVFTMTFLSVSFIGGEYVYLRYIYFVVPLVYLLVGYAFDRYTNLGVLQKIIAGALTIFTLSMFVYGAVKKESPYLFRDMAESNAVLSEYSDLKLIVIGSESERATSVPTGNITKIMQFDEVYLCTKESIKKAGTFEECLNNEEQFVVFIGTSDYWLDGMDPTDTIRELAGGQRVVCTSLTDGLLGEYYLVKKRT